MQNSFYASGFLYSLKTHQILLLSSLKDDTSSVWSTPCGESKEREEALVTFQRIISETLNINLIKKHIYPVYDYFHDALGKINYVFYAEVGKNKIFNASKKGTPLWVSFSEIVKLSFSGRTKQDVVVGERVINAKRLDDEASKSNIIS